MRMLLNLKNIYKNYGKEPLIVPVLKDVSLEVVQGDYVAIMGPSGSGKTTLCSLLSRFYDVTNGSICIDGQNIKDVTLKSLRSNIGLVQQDVYLFTGTIEQNIAYGRPGASHADIVEAAKKANIHDFIMSLPEGYNTFCGERGTRLSGGQKQRVAIARALINHPRILLADEPTGALDQASGKQVMELFKALNDEGVTIIMITHDASVASHAKKILHIIDGEIIENKQGGTA